MNTRQFQPHTAASPANACAGRQPGTATKPVRGIRRLAAAALLSLSAGCSQESITVVQIPKERAAAYAIPSHWMPKAPSEMRFLSFDITDEHGHTGEVSVLPMRQFDITDVQIINFWRQEWGLEPASADQVAKMATEVPIDAFNGKLFDFTIPNSNSDPDHAARIVTAYLHQASRTWFFKLTGPSHIVAAEKPAFLRFLESVNLVKIEQDFQTRAATHTLAPAPARKLPQWDVPENWRSATPKSAIQLASFHTADASNGGAAITVSILPGDGGGLLPNVNRWRREIDLEPITPESLDNVLQPLNLDGRQQGVLVDMASGENRVLVAIVSTDRETWFYKMTGNSAAVEKETATFTNFVRSVKYPGDD